MLEEASESPAGLSGLMRQHIGLTDAVQTNCTAGTSHHSDNSIIYASALPPVQCKKYFPIMTLFSVLGSSRETAEFGTVAKP